MTFMTCDELNAFLTALKDDEEEDNDWVSVDYDETCFSNIGSSELVFVTT